LSIAGVALAAWGLSFVTWTQPFGQPLSVRLLQPNIDPAIKSSPDKFPAALQHYRSLIIAKRADLIVTPETVFPLFWHELPPSYLDGLKHFAQTSGSNILLGVASVQDGQHATNNVVGILADGGASFPRYEKFHLMPFGEYTPVGFGWFSNHPNSSQRDLTAGDWSQPSMAVGVQRLGFMICHEEMFGEEALRWLPEATILVNPSNLAWFINSLASSQMLQIVRMRAVETGRPVLRTPNTGITAIIDHHGKVTASLPPSVSGVLEGTVQGMQGRTPYSSLGNLPVLGIIFLTFFLCAIPSIRKRRSVLSR
jgi:apolipoprotein N-acyltransferase